MADEKSLKEASWFRDLCNSNESLQVVTHRSIYLYLPAFVLGLTLIISGLILPFIISHMYSEYLFALIPVGILIFLGDYFKYITTYYIFTDKRVIKKKGIFYTNVEDIEYSQVQGISKNISIIGRILRYGDLEIETASRDGVDLCLKYVPKPSNAYNVINNH